ncbi:prolyl oligopeptidase family serine peptidase [Candidatus Pacearchaeota archaeon]|nr:prolyl oligopeptidase family serine peptidase [Candidatus Pacearchaeota archaeon]MBD3283687.1 prolyl oligopeptidase family serine peptidase [Candidatus Pacearchaeota archaeon]
MKLKLYFKNSKGNKLCGILSNPTGNLEVPIIVMCIGHSSNKDRPTYTSMEEKLNENEISSFRFDFYGHGESEGKFEDATVSEAVDDAQKAIEFLKNKGYLKIGLFGSSFGGITSLITASKSDDLFVLALKSPVSDYEKVELLRKGEKGIEEWRQRGYVSYDSSDGIPLKLNYSFYEDIKNNNGYEAAKKIKIPTIIVHGDRDEIVPVEQSRKTADIIRNCKLEIVKGADHRYTNPEHFEKCTKLLSDFIISKCK